MKESPKNYYTNLKSKIFNKDFSVGIIGLGYVGLPLALTFAENNTDNVFTKKSFVYDFLSSMRQKINDPLGKRKKP